MSQRSFELAIICICGHASQREEIKNCRSKKWLKGTILVAARDERSLPRAVISGTMRDVAI